MRKILLVFCALYMVCAYSMDLDESYRDKLVFAMDSWSSVYANDQEYASFFLVDALPESSKGVKRSRVDFESADDASSYSDIDSSHDSSGDYSENIQRPKISISRSPVFDSFVYCAFIKDGAEIIDKIHGKIKVNQYKQFLDCIEKVCPKYKQTSDIMSRIKAFKKFVIDWPKKSEAIQGNFTVLIKKSERKKQSGSARFHELINQYQENMTDKQISMPLSKRTKKSED